MGAGRTTEATPAAAPATAKTPSIVAYFDDPTLAPAVLPGVVGAEGLREAVAHAGRARGSVARVVAMDLDAIVAESRRGVVFLAAVVTPAGVRVGAVPRTMTEETIGAMLGEGSTFGVFLESLPEPHKPHQSGVRLLRSFAGDDLGVVVVYAVAVGLLSLAAPVAVQALVNNVGFGLVLQPVVALTVLLFAVLAVSGLLRTLQAEVVEYIQQRVFVRVAAELAWRLPRVDVKALDGVHGPELVNRFFDVLTVQKSAATLLLDGLSLALQLGIGMLLLAFYHPLLLAFDLVLLASTLFIVFWLGRHGPSTAISESKAKYAVAGWLEDLARHPVAFKAGGAAATAISRVDALCQEWLVRRNGQFAIVRRQLIGSFALQAVASAALLGLGGWLVVRGQLSLGQLIAAELVVGSVLAGIAKLGKQLESFYDLLAATDKLSHLIDFAVEPESPGGLEDAGPAAVKLSSVAFERGGLPVFSGVSFEVAARQHVAITGASGSGKSALIDVLYGLRAPTHGAIAINGVDLRELSRDALRGQVALVRGLELVTATVFENVALGRAGTSRQDVRTALAAVGLEERVNLLPDGLDTLLTPDGAPLSLGEARLLMLARAIAGKPRLLLLDEALDGVDPRIKPAILDRLFGAEAPWTVIVVTNRPTVLDRVRLQVALSGATLVVEASR